MLRAVVGAWRGMVTPAPAFQPASLEREFLEDYARRFASERRAMALLAAIIWIPLLCWDLVNVSELGAELQHASLFIGLRFANFVLLMGVAIATQARWMERNERRASVLLGFWCVATFCFSYWQMRLLPPAYGHAYYGLALAAVMTAGFAAMRLRGLPAFWTVSICVLAPTVLLQGEVLLRPGVDLRAEQFYMFKLSNTLLFVGLLGAGLAQQFERTQRAAFMHERELAHSNRTLERQSRELEALNGAIRRASQQTEEKSKLLMDAQTALSVALDAAQAANRAKSEFVANMSHEFRTPMNAIIGLTHLLMQAPLAPGHIEWLRKMETASSHLLSLINAILDISKIEAGKLEIEHEDFDLAATFSQLRALVTEQVQAKGLKIEFDSGEVPARLRGDPTRLLQGLLNYTGNAIKFTTRGTITVRAVLLESGSEEVLVRFEVRDSGAGIAPDQLARLFQAFEQADGSPGLRAAGTGLGLAITKSLAIAMGGDAGATSETGKGSVFWFTARLQRVAEAALAAQPQQPVPDARAELCRLHQGARVLLVEDNDINQEVGCALLSAAGISVEVAGDGLQAIEKASTATYALVLMDMQMPVMDGLDATRVIRALPGWGTVPILAMTADIFNESRQLCREAGMDDFVSKPCHPNELYKALLKWLSPTRPAAPSERGRAGVVA